MPTTYKDLDVPVRIDQTSEGSIRATKLLREIAKEVMSKLGHKKELNDHEAQMLVLATGQDALGTLLSAAVASLGIIAIELDEMLKRMDGPRH